MLLRIFSPAICSLLSAGFHLKGIAHITGGGIIGNLERVLKVKEVGAVLDNLFEPLDVMKKLQKLGNISSETAYNYWNMGNGMLFIIDRSEAEQVLQTTEELGYKAKIVGGIIAEKGIRM